MTFSPYVGIDQVADPVARDLLRRMAEYLAELDGQGNLADAAPALVYEGMTRRFAAGAVGADAGLYEYRGGRWMFLSLDAYARAQAALARSEAAAAQADADAAQSTADTALALAGPATTESLLVVAATTVGTVAKTASATYPPTTSAAYTAGTLAPAKSLATTYSAAVAVLKFDTSSLPDTATVMRASLLLRLTDGVLEATDARRLQGEYRSNAYTTADYADGVSPDAFDLAGCVVPLAGEPLRIPLANLGRINRTGFTELRLGISGGAPTTVNAVTAGVTSGWEPVLEVVYR